MAVDFERYIRSEIEEIRKFRDMEARHRGIALSLDDAANLWVCSGKAAQFRRNYEERQSDG